MAEQTSAEQLVRDCFDWANGEASKVDAMAESLDVYNPGLPGCEVHSREEWAGYLRKIEVGFPDIRYEIEDLVAGDDVVMVELTVAGTHEGEFEGLPPTGREIEIRGMDKFVIEDDEVSEWWSYYNRQEVPDQLGLTFPEVLGQLPGLVAAKLRSLG